jgi:hypothetical protein
MILEGPDEKLTIAPEFKHEADKLLSSHDVPLIMSRRPAPGSLHARY